MGHWRGVLAAGAAFLLPASLALAQVQRQADTMHEMAASEAASPSAAAALMDGMRKMDEQMAGAPMTGDPDRDFVAMMIPHHQGAIDMALVQLKYGKDPMLHQLAQDIVTAQEKEIDAMRRWQESHGKP